MLNALGNWKQIREQKGMDDDDRETLDDDSENDDELLLQHFGQNGSGGNLTTVLRPTLRFPPGLWAILHALVDFDDLNHAFLLVERDVHVLQNPGASVRALLG